MIVLDTSIWIEFLKQNPKYTSKVKKLLEDREVLVVGGKGIGNPSRGGAG